MEQEKRVPILSIDIQIRLRGTVYEISLTRVLKWLAGFGLLGIRLYRAFHGATS